MIVIVLGMHAGGTSLTAKLLMELGVNMGHDFMGPVKGVPTWEDKRFVQINTSILSMAGGSWDNPPRLSDVLKTASRIKGRLEHFNTVKDDLWGFKDPRTALTVHLWHQALEQKAVYVYVKRNPESIARSILERGPGRNFQYWVNTANLYYSRIQSFLNTWQPRYVEIQFEELVKPETCDHNLDKLIWLIQPALRNRMKEAIHFR